ncbi:MAG TPA: DoxX family protein [Prolixibacteraceae bacterium]|nr:DoxX family protein [Prolixibacteraceae bacterium]
MKIAVLIVRILMGLMFLFSSVVVLFKLVPQPELTGDIKIYMDGLNASVYMMTTIKVIELVCAVAFIAGRFVPLATIFIFPINVNILLFHIFLAPEGLVVAILLMIGNLFLAYYHRDKYIALFSSK